MKQQTFSLFRVVFRGAENLLMPNTRDYGRVDALGELMASGGCGCGYVAITVSSSGRRRFAASGEEAVTGLARRATRAGTNTFFAVILLRLFENKITVRLSTQSNGIRFMLVATVLRDYCVGAYFSGKECVKFNLFPRQ